MKTFNLKIVTQEKTSYNEEVISVVLNTAEGEITILAGHEPLMGIISPGEIILEKENGEKTYIAATEGFFKVDSKGVVVLVDAADRVDEIEEKKAEEARERAERIMHSDLSERERAQAQVALQKSLLHIKIARRHKRTRPLK